MTILAATDFSEPSRRALRIAGREARLREEPLCIVHSVEFERSRSRWWTIFESDSDNITPDRLHENARRRLETFVREQLPVDRRPPATVYQTAIDSPAESVCALAEHTEPSLIAIGATGRGSFESVVVGSTAEEIIRTAPAPVLTATDHADDGAFEVVLVPVDFSDSCTAGLTEAVAVARRDGARLIVMYEAVLKSPGFGRPRFGPNDGVEDAHRREAEAELSEYLGQFDLSGLEVETSVHVRDYDTHPPADAIVTEADRRDVDLIAMGTHGRRGWNRFLMGSTTLKVLHEMPCCLLTVLPDHCRRDGD